MFKQECNKFLDTITSMRAAAITKATDEALRTQHVPYIEKVNAACNEVINEEQKKTEELIKTLQEDLQRKINTYKTESAEAIAKHKQQVTDIAITKAKNAYDNFILGVGKLVDETKID